MRCFALVVTICTIFKKMKNTHGGVLISKNNTSPWDFSRFLNCINCTKSHVFSNNYHEKPELETDRDRCKSIWQLWMTFETTYWYISTEFLYWKIRKQLNQEEVVWRCSVEKVFLEISQNSQENTCARVSFLTRLNTFQEHLFLLNTSGGCFCKLFGAKHI